MSEPWLRLYVGVVHDPKLQKLPAETFRVLVNVWCVASAHGGMIPPLADLAFILRKTPTKVQTLLDELLAAGLIDEDENGLHPHNWSGRQFQSDISTQRVKRHRERKLGVSPETDETFPETPHAGARAGLDRADTEQSRAETEHEPNGSRDFSKPSPPQAEESLPTEEPDPPPGEMGEFWAAATRLEQRKVARSRCGQILKLMPLHEALAVLAKAEKARDPASYLGKVIDARRKERANATAPPGANGAVPEWVAERRRDGENIIRDGKMWRWGEGLYSDQGDQIGY